MQVRLVRNLSQTERTLYDIPSDCSRTFLVTTQLSRDENHQVNSLFDFVVVASHTTPVVSERYGEIPNMLGLSVWNQKPKPTSKVSRPSSKERTAKEEKAEKNGNARKLHEENLSQEPAEAPTKQHSSRFTFAKHPEARDSNSSWESKEEEEEEEEQE